MKLFTQRAVTGLFFAVLLLVGLVLLLRAFADSRREASTLREETRGSAMLAAELIVGAVEHAMLQGQGIAVQGLVDRFKADVPRAGIEVYDRRGIEVFAAKGPTPRPDQIPTDVRRVLDGGSRTVGEGGSIYRPIASDERCAKCHDEDDDGLRAVLTLALDRDACARERDATITRLVLGGFIHVMTAKRTKLLDDYFGDLSTAAPGVRQVTVYDDQLQPQFGDAIEGLTPHQLADALAGHEPLARTSVGPDPLELVQLRIGDRCVACHDEEPATVIGVLAVALAPAAEGAGCAEAELEGVIDASLRVIMLSRLGRRISDFLDDAADTNAIRTLELYDREGRRYWTTEHPAPPPHVAKVLDSGSASSTWSGAGDDEHVRVIMPLRNKTACARCHGTGAEMLGAVSVSLSTAGAAKARRATMKRRATFTSYTLLGSLLVLAALLQFFAVKTRREHDADPDDS